MYTPPRPGRHICARSPAGGPGRGLPGAGSEPGHRPGRTNWVKDM